MANKQGHKIKILYIMNMLLNESDREHPINANDIIGRLADMGIVAERKSIYADISTLIEYGLDIEKSEEYKGGYYIASQLFNRDELQLIISAIKASDSISDEKAKSLIKRIIGLGNIYDAEKLL